MTRPGLPEARALFEAVRDADAAGGAVLAAAMPRWAGFAPGYARYRRLSSSLPGDVADGFPEDLWTFHALGRLFDRLLLGPQGRAGLPSREGTPLGPFAAVTGDDLLRFFGTLGMDRLASGPACHPFFHEVAAVVTDPGLGDAVLVEEELWPGLRFGNLVFARAGVRVRAGPAAPLDAALAVASTLYFSPLRPHRPTADLSHGWGSNSTWRTRFRRDYADGATLRYNVDGRTSLTPEAIVPPPDAPRPPDDDLTPAERIELLTHRCFVRTAKPHGDRWPFDDRYAEPATPRPEEWGRPER